MKKHVWILNHYAGNMFFDHGGRHYCFAKYLRRAGYEPVVFCCNSKHGKPEQFYESDSLWHEHVAEEIGTPFVFVKARTYVGNGKQRVLNMVDFYRNVQKTAKEYAKLHGKPDMIYASSVHPLTLVAGERLAKYFGVQCICEVRDLWPESLVAYGYLKRSSVAAKILYQGEKWIYRKADKIIMTWPGGYDYIVDQGWEKQIPESKVFHLSNGVDLESFLQNARDSAYQDEVLERDDVIKAVYTGAIRKVNNLQLLVDAAELLKRRNVQNVQLLIWGDGDEKALLEQQAHEKGLDNICFKGRVPKTAIPSILQQADISILHNTSTSLNKYGQSQNKFFEYLAAGHPVLMTYTVGHSICRSQNCGIELEQQTPEAIADALEQFSMLSEEEYQAYCHCANTAAKEYDFCNLTKKLIEIIEN